MTTPAPIHHGPAKIAALTGSGAAQQIIGPRSELIGFALTESTGSAPATVNIYNGQGPGATLVTSVTLTAGQSTRDHYGHPGLLCDGGIYVTYPAGSVVGSVWWELLRPTEGA